MRVGAYSYIGGTRGENQDRYGIGPNFWAIADGMGGCNGGSQAADTAIQVISDFPYDRQTPVESLQQALQEANRHVYDQGTSSQSLRGMGTTLTVGYLVDNVLYIGHVGDSRIYLIRDHTIRQLTQDHSFVGELLRDGAISADEALHHPNRNILTRAIGVAPEITIDISQEKIALDDILVLCTDGVCGVLTDEDILEIVEANPEPNQAAKTLCHEADRRGGTDNATAIVICFLPPQSNGLDQMEFGLENRVESELTLI